MPTRPLLLIARHALREPQRGGQAGGRDRLLPGFADHLRHRHTAASLALEAGLDIKIVSEQMGHSTTRITQDLYQHVRRSVAGEAAERVAGMLPSDDDGRPVR